MRKITVSIVVKDAWAASERALKNEMVQEAMERIKVDKLDLVRIEVSVGNVRAK